MNINDSPVFLLLAMYKMCIAGYMYVWEYN
jgi:hypothetical protein